MTKIQKKPILLASKSSKKTLEQVLNPEEMKEVQPLIKLDAYRTLTKLAVDHQPLMKLNSYCAMVLEEHAAYMTGSLHAKMKGKG